MRLVPQVDVQQLRRLLTDGQAATAGELSANLTPAELADVLVKLTPAELVRLDPYVGRERLADAVAELDATEAARLIMRLGRAAAADILEEMEPDDATEVVDELEYDDAWDVLSEMDTGEADEIRELMAYPWDTAGGHMTPAFISLEPGITVAVALRWIRAQAPEAETIYYIYVTERNHRLVGVVSLRDLVTSDPQRHISEIMRRQVIRVPAEADQETAARLLIEHDLLALPVVDPSGRVLGVITADDVADVLEDEATEDIAKLGGSQPLEVPYLNASILQVARKRIGWLLALFFAEAYTGTVLRHFEDTLAAVVSLSFFIPLLIGTGGNVGSQTTTTLTRALGVGDVKFRDLFRVLRKELGVAVLLATAMATATFLRAWTLGVEPEVRIVVAITAAAVVIWAQTVAAVLPLVLRRIGVDSAVVSAPLISTLVDGTGLFLYLSIARVLMGV